MKTSFKKSFLFIALFAAFAMITASCSKSKDSAANSTPDPTPTPGPTTTTLYYKVSNYNAMNGHTASDCFHFNISYTEADGSTTTVENAALPWVKSITVTAPFEAKLEGQIYYNEEEMPDTVCFCKAWDITDVQDNPFTNSYHLDGLKDNMINLFAAHPDRLTFSKTLLVEE